MESMSFLLKGDIRLRFYFETIMRVVGIGENVDLVYFSRGTTTLLCREMRMVLNSVTTKPKLQSFLELSSKDLVKLQIILYSFTLYSSTMNF